MKELLLYILKVGAALPVWLKSGISGKVMARLLFLYKKVNGREVVVHSNLGIQNGLRVELPLIESPSHFLYGLPKSYHGEYHSLKLSLLLANFCTAFIDIGANWGYYTYYIATNSSIPVYWFEPNNKLYDNLYLKTIKNSIENVKGYKIAVANSTGTLSFHINKDSDLMSSLINPGKEVNTEEVKVESIRFDDWVFQQNIQGKLLVKVDVENAEWNFIEGAIKALDKIKYLIIEVLGPARQSGFVNHMIDELGLQAYYINKNKIEHVTEDDMRYTNGEFNWLFCREQPSVLNIKLNRSFFKISV